MSIKKIDLLGSLPTLFDRTTIAAKHTAVFALFAFLLTTTLLIYGIPRHEKQERIRASLRTQSITNLIAFGLSSPMASGNASRVREAVLTVRDVPGVVAVSVRDLSGQEIQRYEQSSRSGTMSSAETRIVYSGITVGSVRTEMSLDYLDRQVWELKFSIIAGGFAFFGLGTIMMAGFSRFTTSSLKDLVAVAGRAARGDSRARTRFEARDEIGMVGRTFDHMLDRIQELQERAPIVQPEIAAQEESMREHGREWESLRAALDHHTGIVYILDHAGRLVIANQATVRLLGTTLEDLLRRPPFNLFECAENRAAASDRELSQKGESPIGEECFTDPAGKKRWFITLPRVFLTGDGDRQLLVMAHEVTARVVSEKALTDSLQEKDFQLKEILYRTKNTLQIITRVLGLQIHPPVGANLAVTVNQNMRHLIVLALVQEKLFQLNTLARVDLSEYLHRLSLEVARSGGKPWISCEIAAEPAFVDASTAVACGMIVSELATNSFVHAFPHHAPGFVLVSLHKSPAGKLELAVLDDGIGISAPVDLRHATTAGLGLVMTLVDLLNGNCTLTRDGGTTIAIEFTPPTYGNLSDKKDGSDDASAPSRNLVNL